MINIVPRNILRFIVFIGLQVLLFNNIQFSGYINPFIYIAFIILLPFETPRWFLLILGFLTGITVDIFMNTYGMHSSATIFMAFIRPYVLNLIAPRDGYETGTFPWLSYYGFGWFLKYTLILTFVHHFVLFYIEIFRFSSFFDTLLKVLGSTLFSLLFIILSQFLSFRMKK